MASTTVQIPYPHLAVTRPPNVRSRLAAGKCCREPDPFVPAGGGGGGGGGN